MITKSALFFTLVVLPLISIGQISIKQIDSLISNYALDKNETLIIQYINKFKSSIAEDTSISHWTILLENNNTRIYYKADYIDKDGNMPSSRYGEYNKNFYYEIDNFNRSYKKVKFKGKRSYYGIINLLEDLPSLSLNKFRQELINSKSVKTEIGLQFFSGNSTYFFYFGNNDFKKTTIIPTNQGMQIEELNYRLIRNNNNKEFLLSESSVLNELSEMNSKESKNTANKIKINSQIFDASILTILKSTNPEKQFFLIDLFYQSCLPCIKLIPELNDISKDTLLKNVQVIGVDNILNDTLNMDKFIKRYDIQYPIIKGQDAVTIWEVVRNSTYPTKLLVDNSGILLYYDTGFEKGFSEKIKRILIKN